MEVKNMMSAVQFLSMLKKAGVPPQWWWLPVGNMSTLLNQAQGGNALIFEEIDLELPINLGDLEMLMEWLEHLRAQVPGTLDLNSLAVLMAQEFQRAAPFMEAFTPQSVKIVTCTTPKDENIIIQHWDGDPDDYQATPPPLHFPQAAPGKYLLVTIERAKKDVSLDNLAALLQLGGLKAGTTGQAAWIRSGSGKNDNGVGGYYWVYQDGHWLEVLRSWVGSAAWGLWSWNEVEVDANGNQLRYDSFNKMKGVVEDSPIPLLTPLASS